MEDGELSTEEGEVSQGSQELPSVGWQHQLHPDHQSITSTVSSGLQAQMLHVPPPPGSPEHEAYQPQRSAKKPKASKAGYNAVYGEQVS